MRIVLQQVARVIYTKQRGKGSVELGEYDERDDTVRAVPSPENQRKDERFRLGAKDHPLSRIASTEQSPIPLAEERFHCVHCVPDSMPWLTVRYDRFQDPDTMFFPLLGHLRRIRKEIRQIPRNSNVIDAFALFVLDEEIEDKPVVRAFSIRG